jgi:hypothetical protein
MLRIGADDATKGRALYAAQNFSAGEVVLEEYPLLLCVDQEAKGLACARCLRLLSLTGMHAAFLQARPSFRVCYLVPSLDIRAAHLQVQGSAKSATKLHFVHQHALHLRHQSVSVTRR